MKYYIVLLGLFIGLFSASVFWAVVQFVFFTSLISICYIKATNSIVKVTFLPLINPLLQ